MTMQPYHVQAERTNDGTIRLSLPADLPRYYEQVIAAKLSAMTPLISAYPASADLPLCWASMVQLEDTFGESLITETKLAEWRTGEIMRQVTALRDSLSAPVVSGLDPYPWQVTGANQIAHQGRMLLTDEQGTGKTITAVLGIREREYIYGDAFPAIVIAPSSVVDTWIDAWQWVDPDSKVIAWRGTPKQRDKLSGTAHVYVVSYDTARIDADKLRKLHPASVIMDECQAIKNSQSKRSKACRKLASTADIVVAMSGTPVSQGPDEMWPSLVSMMPLAWPSRDRWVRRYCLVEPGYMKDEVVGLDPHTEPEFRRIMAGSMRRVAKADVLQDLPPKVYSTRYVDMPDAYAKTYRQLESRMIAEMPDGEELSVMSGATLYLRLSQLASAAADVESYKDVDSKGNQVVKYKVDLKSPSWKVDALLDILEERPGQPVVCFSSSRQLINLAGEAAEQQGYRVGYVVGGQKPSDRTANVNDFQAGKLDLICVTTQAGGTGLTLTRASTAVFLTRPWSYIDSSQAEDRLHRIGSTGDCVEIIDVVTKGSVDTKIRNALKLRAGQWAELAQDPRILLDALGG